MNKSQRTGHIIAVMTMLLWGTTFISTKVLLTGFTPVEILFIRFVTALVVLTILHPHMMGRSGWRQELYFAGAGLTGICMYYLLENIALTYTMASNAGVLVSIAPFFTGILGHLVFREKEKLHPGFFAGFIVAIAGISLISYNGSRFHLSPKGDILCIAAAAVWACYSVCIAKINEFGYHNLASTRRVFMYGIVFMIPALFVFGFSPDLSLLADPKYLSNLAFLGVGASAICFASWNKAVSILGVIKSSIYIYLGPVVTLTASVLILKEPLTLCMAAGAFLTLSGLMISESPAFFASLRAGRSAGREEG